MTFELLIATLSPLCFKCMWMLRLILISSESKVSLIPSSSNSTLCLPYLYAARITTTSTYFLLWKSFRRQSGKWRKIQTGTSVSMVFLWMSQICFVLGHIYNGYFYTVMQIKCSEVNSSEDFKNTVYPYEAIAVKTSALVGPECHSKTGFNLSQLCVCWLIISNYHCKNIKFRGANEITKVFCIGELESYYLSMS